MFQPGTNWYYSASVDIQGYIVEKLSGQTLGQFMQDRIFTPLKMPDTAFFTGSEKASRLAAVYVFDRDLGKIIEAKQLFGVNMPDYTKPPAAESGGGGLVSTTMDYARFSQMLANGGELDGVRILSPATVELMGTNVIPKNVLVSNNGTGVASFNEAVGFGLDFQVATDARASGSLQLIAGQVADLEGEGRDLSVPELKYIHERKTSALLCASVRLGGMSANCTPAQLKALTTFGYNVGLAFQVIDDILDVTQTSEKLGKTAGKDVAAQKATYPRLVGLEKSRKIAAQLTARAFDALKPFKRRAPALEALAHYLLKREN
jgi:hypothetical protein